MASIRALITATPRITRVSTQCPITAVSSAAASSDVNQDIVEMGQETEPCGLARLLGERILTVLLEPRGGFCAANTFGGTVGAGQVSSTESLKNGPAGFVCTRLSPHSCNGNQNSIAPNAQRKPERI
jgi:hypothetical protein